jgi:alpha-tubulin suppressor-like RCC1 family protein
MPLNEGQTVQYTVITTRVADGTVLYWKTTGNTTNSDIVGGNTGSITITNNRAYINVTPSLDLTTDGTKTLGIALLTGSLNGTQVTTTASEIVVDDTSVPPVIRLFTWGDNTNGELGQNDTVRRSSPVQVGTDTSWNKIPPVGGQGAIKSDGTLWTWGSNSGGQLGINNNTIRYSPTQVSGATWNKIASQSMATKTDGTLWLWGNNAYGQLGQNDRVNASSPVQVAGTTWNNIADGGLFKIATKTDGTLWAWGWNFRGNLGNNMSDIYPPYGSRSSPIQVGSDTNWNNLFCDSVTVFATKTDGTLWAWGSNRYGQLGVNSSTNISSPTAVGSSTNWLKVSTNTEKTLAIKTDGTLWAWGDVEWGALGNNSSYGRPSSPVQIGATTNWNDVSTGDAATLATKTNGTLWSWGYNRGVGVLGNNDANLNISSPVQVGSLTNWNLVSAGGGGTAMATTFRD